jgi:aminoglycoside 3'-phosphotransferase II
MELFGSLQSTRPDLEDSTVKHGDPCLSNLIFKKGRFSGFVDCDRCGRADRYQDLALGHRGIARNFGSTAGENFLAAHGLEHVDTEKLSYYRMLDDFFWCWHHAARINANTTDIR